MYGTMGKNKDWVVVQVDKKKKKTRKHIHSYIYIYNPYCRNVRHYTKLKTSQSILIPNIFITTTTTTTSNNNNNSDNIILENLYNPTQFVNNY